MLYTKAFNNYAEFQQIFGIREFDGRKTRKNKILLSLIKDPTIRKEAIKSGDYTLLSITNMTDLKQILTKKIRISGVRSSKNPYKVEVLGKTYKSHIYSTDHWKGLCEDGSPGFVRYHNHENDGTFKMKAGKFYRSLIADSPFGRKLPEQIQTWLSEEFATAWRAYTIGQLPENKLIVNDDFKSIYSHELCKGGDISSDPFTSCMTDKGYHTFYNNCVKAKAASIIDADGLILARCVIFMEVHESGSDKIWRYAERQYAHRNDDVLKRALVDALIQAGEIDCYKKVGAGCHDCTAIVDIDGNSLADKEFWIECWADTDSRISYQDTFKAFEMHKQKAWNCEADGDEYALDVTGGWLEHGEDDDDDPQEWDDYHEEYVYETRTVYYHGDMRYCDIDRLDDFTEFNGRYYHEDDFVICPHCGKRMLTPDYYEEDEDWFWSKITDEKYCSSECRKEAEQKYKAKHWHWSDYDQDWTEKAEDVVTYQHYDSISGDYQEKTIFLDTLDYEHEYHQKFHLIDGTWYDCIFDETGFPYGYELSEETILSELTSL